MKHLPWNTYLTMTGKRNRQLSTDERTALQAVQAAQYRAQEDPNSPYWQTQVANCRQTLAADFPDHLLALDTAVPGLFTPGATATWRSLAEFLTPRIRQLYFQFWTPAEAITHFSKGGTSTTN